MQRKKLLWLLPYFPYPLLSGGNVRVFNLIKHLGPMMDIDILSFAPPGIPPAHIQAVEKHCRKVTVVERKLREGDLPLIFQHYFTAEMRSRLQGALENPYDFIQIDYLTMAYYAKMIKEKSSVPLLLTDHDVSWLDFDRCFHNRHLENPARYCQWVKMHEVIDEIYPLFDAVITVSGNDARILKEHYPDKEVFAAPTGTDCSFYSYKEGRDSCDLIYTGHYVHYPNVDSVNYFLENIFPILKKNRPGIRFYIVGSGGKKAFPRPVEDSVTVTGTVDDIRKYLWEGGAFVAPIRVGIGIRGKILEAMAAGLPVVSTSAAARGVGAENGREILVADEAGEFARRVEEVLSGGKLARNLASAARKFVEENYDWPVRAGELYEVYRRYG